MSLHRDLISPNFESVYYAEDGQKVRIQVCKYNKTNIFVLHSKSVYVSFCHVVGSSKLLLPWSSAGTPRVDGGNGLMSGTEVRMLCVLILQR